MTVTQQWQVSAAFADLLNRVDEGWHTFSYVVPMRVVRVVRRTDWCHWRVEKLNLHNKDRVNPRGAWQTINIFVSDKPGEQCAPAMQCAIATAAKVKAVVERKMQQINRQIAEQLRRP